MENHQDAADRVLAPSGFDPSPNLTWKEFLEVNERIMAEYGRTLPPLDTTAPKRGRGRPRKNPLPAK